VGYMLFDGFKSETYFYTVDQAVAQGPALPGQTIRVKGLVEPGSVVTEKGKLGTTFRVAEKGHSLAVSYDKALPDTFKEGMEVVVQGNVDSHYTLTADEVLVKCPSRYEGQAPTAAGQVEHPADIPKIPTQP
jgi:cytochrome c-type biogenesis protein CcmE